MFFAREDVKVVVSGVASCVTRGSNSSAIYDQILSDACVTLVGWTNLGNLARREQRQKSETDWRG